MEISWLQLLYRSFESVTPYWASVFSLWRHGSPLWVRLLPLEVVPNSWDFVATFGINDLCYPLRVCVLPLEVPFSVLGVCSPFGDCSQFLGFCCHFWHQ